MYFKLAKLILDFVFALQSEKKRSVEEGSRSIDLGVVLMGVQLVKTIIELIGSQDPASPDVADTRAIVIDPQREADAHEVAKVLKGIIDCADKSSE
jgi:hypothetical protein